MTDLELEDLRMIVAVAESGSLTAASTRLDCSLNAVSRRLARLEERAGVRLVERTTRRQAVTEAGERLYRRALAALEHVDLARAELQDHLGQPEGTVRLVLPSSVVTAPLLREVQALLVAHARLKVQLLVTHRALPLGNDLDLAVVVGPLPDRAGLVARKIADVRWHLCAAPAYLATRGTPATPAELSRHDCLRFRGDTPQERWTLIHDDGREEIIPVGGAFEADDSRVLGDATYAGLGIGIRPRSELVQATADGSLCEVLPGWQFAPMPIYLVSPRGRGRLPGVRTVAAAVTSAVQALM
jgi:LysR family transcriptional activator of dmlA